MPKLSLNTHLNEFYCKPIINLHQRISPAVAQDTKDTGAVELDSLKLAKILQEVHVPAFLDSLGPESVVHVYDHDIDLQGVLVIDNTVLGPGKGGIRIQPTVTPREIFKLARTMTYKCSLANVSFGGAYAGIRADPFKIDKITFVRSFARGIAPYVPDRYIAGPETNVGEEEIVAFVEEIGDLQGATGKPEKMGGIPHGLKTTEFGVGVALETGLAIAHEFFRLPNDVAQMRIAILGFDAIGSGIARYLANKKATIVAIGDRWGAAYNKDGIRIEKALKHACATSERQSIKNLRPASILSRDDVLGVNCDLMILASYGTIDEERAMSINAKFIVEATNNAMTPGAEQILYKKGAFILPDILVTSGGVIGSYAEYRRMSIEKAFTLIETMVKANTKLIVQRSLESALLPRRIAREIATERVVGAMEK